MRSGKLRHFTETDPISTTHKAREREELKDLVKKFLSNGGQIHVLESNTASHSNIVNVSGPK